MVNLFYPTLKSTEKPDAIKLSSSVNSTQWLHFSALGNWAYRKDSGKLSLYKTVHFTVLIAIHPSSERDRKCVSALNILYWVDPEKRKCNNEDCYLSRGCDLLWPQFRAFNLLLDYSPFLSLFECTCRPICIRNGYSFSLACLISHKGLSVVSLCQMIKNMAFSLHLIHITALWLPENLM